MSEATTNVNSRGSAPLGLGDDDGFLPGYRAAAVHQVANGDHEQTDPDLTLPSIVEAQEDESRALLQELEYQLVQRIGDCVDLYRHLEKKVTDSVSNQNIATKLVQIASGHPVKYERKDFISNDQDWSQLLDEAEEIGEKVIGLIRNLERYREYTLEDAVIRRLMTDLLSSLSPEY